MSIREEIEALRDEKGLWHAPLIVGWARDNPDSALHKALEWDNDKAADAYRIWQVRRLIQIHVVEEDGTPKMVSLSLDRKNGGGYRDIREAAKVPDLAEIMLRDATAELQRVRERYKMVQALVKVWSAIDETVAEVKAPKPKKSAEAEAVEQFIQQRGVTKLPTRFAEAVNGM